jgi:DNA-binding MarR family transcriptional regulator
MRDRIDRRRVRVELTERGLDRVENATRARFEIASAALARLDHESRRRLSDLLRLLVLAQEEEARP